MILARILCLGHKIIHNAMEPITSNRTQYAKGILRPMGYKAGQQIFKRKRPLRRLDFNYKMPKSKSVIVHNDFTQNIVPKSNSLM